MAKKTGKKKPAKKNPADIPLFNWGKRYADEILSGGKKKKKGKK